MLFFGSFFLFYLMPPITDAITAKSPVVETATGAVVGSTEVSAKGREYFAYRSVPYGGFIEGETRFKVKKISIHYNALRVKFKLPSDSIFRPH